MNSFTKDSTVSDLDDSSTSVSSRSSGNLSALLSSKLPSDLLKLIVEKKHEQAVNQLFDLIHLKGNNVLSPDEIFLCLKNTSLRMNVKVDDNVIRAAVRTLVKEVGVEDTSLSITREQFYDIFHRNPDMFCVFHDEEKMSFQFPSSKYKYVLSRQDVEEDEEDYEDVNEVEREAELWERAKTRMADRGTEMIWLLVYLAANIATFVHAAVKWASNEDATALFGNCVIVARSSAATLNLNGALILLPVSRHFLTRLRGTFLRFLIPFDACLDFHMLVGIVFCIFSTSHVLAHVCDYTRFVKGDESDIVALFGDSLGDIPESKSGRLALALKEPVTITGVIMVICLCVAVWALRQRRRRHFNRFWYLHHLFILMLMLMCVHGISSLLQHYQSVFWVCGGFALYATPRLYREFKCRTVKVLSATIHGDVLEIELEKPIGWQSVQQAGMYAYLNIPSISRLEWHPFAMSSSPYDNHVNFHIKAIGDWTEEAMKTVQESLLESGTPEGDAPFSVRVDGPIGASFQDFKDHPVCVLIGAGIGCTPLISVLRTLLIEPGRMQRTFFYWTVRERTAFDMFDNLMDEIFNQDKHQVLEIRNFVTSLKHDDRDLGQILFYHACETLHAETNYDVLLGHKSRQQVKVGRPDWEKELTYLMRRTREVGGNSCRIFLCGPYRLSEELYKASSRLSKKHRFQFFFSKETF